MSSDVFVAYRNSNVSFIAPNGWKIRLLQQTDIKGVKDVCKSLFEHDFVPVLFEHLENQPSVYPIGAEVDGRVVGWNKHGHFD